MSSFQRCAVVHHGAPAQRFPTPDFGKPCKLEKLAGRVGSSLAYAFFLSLQRCSCVHLTTADELDLLGPQQQQSQQREEEDQEQERSQRRTSASKSQQPGYRGDDEEHEMEEEDLDRSAQHRARCLCLFPRNSPSMKRRTSKNGRPSQLQKSNKSHHRHTWTLAMVSKQHLHSVHVMERFV